ncbi:ATP-binding protein (plasmid) [Ralstonia solanacearum P673]|uniref:sensor histidine kinase n=1 Tax=Ralstonia solanacearum TaxID=305 RepID=UPI00057FC273|nr:HAMP domain-containing sensor histidine kinase [Ralstonia solanacearum]MCL9848478.1 HAMP domain-containing histidine kinase [Ralstonia solanacearum]MCL9853809.1 HAMP domain-containing histidine kinase [Ralstonia solanacearum]MCL9861251.1 HAMP domain-containing histidine kinase [Ralstonia solanacearum]MCL9862812.1 HAMP domain-containing histidine kinase [Ralstonia solanacearum]MCL9870182.1 HAMP domain-containing histidine kinase [Ralstonia solanacearum]
MFRVRLSLAFALMVALVCVQAGFVYWGANRVNDYATHSRLASDILSELLELSANKQRLRVWASQRLMNADASPEVRDRLLASMQASAATLRYLARRDIDLWGEISARDGEPTPPEVLQLASVTDLLGDNIAAVQARLVPLVPLVPLQRDADFAGVWHELNEVFDMARGRDLRELINGAIERQRRAVPIARAATERGLDRVRTQALSMVVLVLLAAVTLALHLNRRLQRPLDRLLEGARALRTGALDHRVPIGSGDEFDRVAEGFNAMAAELQQHRNDADAARRRLEDAVQARTGELRTAHDALQRIDQRRRQLFADLGHELRTPTTAIRGEAEIALRGGDKPPHEYRMALERIVGGAKQLTGRINDLLLIAKAEADQLAMRPQLIDLPSVLHDAADLADALGAEHDVKIQLELPQDTAALTLPADPDRLRQAIVIVLDNAVRYSPRGGTVQLRCHLQPDAVRIEVQDHGIGIDADELPMVFERFVRGRRARAHRADGTGIGLSIAQAIVQAHRGHITLQSAPQQGTRVCIELPRHHAAGADDTPHRHEHSRH